MKLYTIILPAMALAASLSSCDAVYEDLNPCPQGADVHLTFTKNIVGADAFEQVQNPLLLLYNDNGQYVGRYSTLGTNIVSMDLPAGKYHALVYGGMNLSESAYAFNKSINEAHAYTELETYLRGTRTISSVNSKFTPQFHGQGDFVVPEDASNHIKTSIDLTKNTNSLWVVFQHIDGSAVDMNKFDIQLLADNVAMNHKNEIINQGKDMVYRPHSYGEGAMGFFEDGREIKTGWAEVNTGRIMADSDTKIVVDSKADNRRIITIPLVKYFEQIKDSDLGDVTMQDYLDRQDRWSFVFMLDPNTETIAGLRFTINDWTVVINEYEL